MAIAELSRLTRCALCVSHEGGHVAVGAGRTQILHGISRACRAVGTGRAWSRHVHTPETPVPAGVVATRGHVLSIKILVVSEGLAVGTGRTWLTVALGPVWLIVTGWTAGLVVTALVTEVSRAAGVHAGHLGGLATGAVVADAAQTSGLVQAGRLTVVARGTVQAVGGTHTTSGICKVRT